VSQDERVTLLQRLIDLTEVQIAAALQFDSDALLRCTEQRSELLFHLRLAMTEPVPPAGPERDQLAERAETLSRLERRLTHVVSSVLHTLDQIAPPTKPPPTYRATGRLTG
jgi:hypothetical protein